MSEKKRILYIATEMSPYLEMTEFAEVINKLAIKSNDSGLEVRCIMPRFGVINERRHRLHEVVRLSGINVQVDSDDYPLQIKVASLPNARLQVYFLENEDFFKRKHIFHDENETWFDFMTKALINTNVKEKELDAFKELSNSAMFRGGATYADAISFGSDVIDKKLVTEFSSVKGKKVVPFNGWDSDLTEYLDLYNELAGK